MSQRWSQWDEDAASVDALLRGIEASFPRVQQGAGSEEQVSEVLSIYQVNFLLIHLHMTLMCHLLTQRLISSIKLEWRGCFLLQHMVFLPADGTY